MLGVSAPTPHAPRCGQPPDRDRDGDGCTAAQPVAQLSVAVSGIAGPGGGTPDKPVGDRVAGLGHGPTRRRSRTRFPVIRLAVRAATIDAALRGLLERGR